MTQPAFKDNFSKQSDLYVKYRPLYPNELYSYLASLTPGHEQAVDCGTGNGQAAIGLTPYFDKVLATDPSSKQLENCFEHDKVTYKTEQAEHISLPDDSADMLTVANALHWFDLEKFYREANRVIKHNGIIAAWAYFIPVVSKEIDAVLDHFHFEVLDDYWLPENRLVEKKYTTIPFPYEKISNPSFSYSKEMGLNELIGYLNTWSGTQRYIAQNKHNPTDEVYNKLAKIWPDNEVKIITWNLTLKVGRVNKNKPQ